LTGIGHPKFVDRRDADEARAQDGGWEFAHHQAADLARRMDLLAIRKTVKRRVVAVLGEVVKGGVAAHRKSRKILADAFSVLLPLGLDGTPGLIRVFHRYEAHD
jgi:hypothetical protein